MYHMINVIALGILFLPIYFVIDFFRNKTRNIVRRVIFYSFIFYLLNVVHLTMGYIVFPLIREFAYSRTQFVPFYFIWDFVRHYQSGGFDWFFWNSVRLSFNNLIMLMPLGVYLSILFNVKRIKKVVVTVFLVSLTIETSQLVFGSIGFIMHRTFDIDDLLLNTCGGVIGFVFIDYMMKIVSAIRNKQKVDMVQQ